MADWTLSFTAAASTSSPAATSSSVTVDTSMSEFTLGRQLLGQEFVYVSRKQAVLLPQQGGGLLLRSEGKANRTGVKPCGQADWVWLSSGETRALSSGDMIALDAQLKPGTVCTLIDLNAEQQRKRQRLIEDEGDLHDFSTGNVYLNLLPGEVPSPRHVSWSDLVPEGCESAFFTSLFPDGSFEWLRKVSPQIPRALLIADRIPKPNGHPPPVLRSPNGDGWLLLEGQRRSGIVHCSLILFRTPTLLRFICGGTNLEGQYERDRDALFVQDFPIAAGCRPAQSPAFGARLESFLEYLPFAGLQAAERQRVDEFCAELLRGVDFRSAHGALVTCTPGGAAGVDKGGWSMLRRSLRELGAPCCAPGRLDIATGHFGAISAPFLALMATTLRNGEQAESEWCAIDEGRTFLYHSSRSTVLQPRTNSFAVLRTTAPGDRAGAATDATLLDQYFHDAVPTYERARDAPADALTPILHGKAMLAVASDGSGAICFVGSQNFSKASWGEGGLQPTNVELGVVTVARTPQAAAELRARFPIELAPDADHRKPAAARRYVMARGPTDGDNSMGGLQMRWRMQCNDLGVLPAWRLFLHRWWGICSRCLAEGLPCALRVPEMERLAVAGEPFLCAACKAVA